MNMGTVRSGLWMVNWPVIDSPMGKLYVSEAATNVTRRCAQLAGFDGYTRDYPFERLMRDAKITEIYEGTSEVQKMVISSWMGVK